MTYQQYNDSRKSWIGHILIIILILSTSLQGCKSCKTPTKPRQSDSPSKQPIGLKDPADEQRDQQNADRSTKQSLEATKKLFEAIEQGDLAGVRVSIQQGADTNATDAQGDPLLRLALTGTNQHPTIVQALIEHGANTHFLNGDNGSLLYAAVLSAKPEVFKVLLASSAKTLIDHQDKNGLTPLHRALYFADNPDVLENMRLLLENNAGVDIRSNTQETPLYNAIFMRQIKVARLLIQYGADPLAAIPTSSNPSQHTTPLQLAYAINNPDLIDLLTPAN